MKDRITLFNDIERNYALFILTHNVKKKHQLAAKIVREIMEYHSKELLLLQAEHAMNNMAINFYPAPTHVKEKSYYCPPIYNAKVDERRKELSIPKFIKPHLRPLIWLNQHQEETAYSLHARLNKVLKWFLTREGKCTHYLVRSTVHKPLVYPWEGLSQWWKKFIKTHISSFD